MALIHIRIFNKSVDDSLVFRLIIGGICLLVLILLIGMNATNEWIIKSLLLQTAVVLLVLPLTFLFIEEQLELRHLPMMAIGITIIIGYSLWSGISMMIIIVSIIQSILWLTVFSMLFAWSKKL